MAKDKTFTVKLTGPNKVSDYFIIKGENEFKIAKKLLELGVVATDFKQVK